MTNPSPEQRPDKPTIQLFIEERLGWRKMCCGNQLVFDHWHEKNECHLGGGPPNWPESHDAARGLEVGIRPAFEDCLTTIMMLTNKPNSVNYFRPGSQIWATPQQWCLAWILSEHGYRWDDGEWRIVE